MAAIKGAQAMPAGLYGNGGPVKKLGNQIDNQRPLTTRIERPTRQPTDRITAVIAKVPGLTARQRAAVVKAVAPLMAGAADEGRPL
jgi:hypothetical protein